MKATLALIYVLTMCIASAEPLFLVDEDGTRHGPLELRNAGEVPLRGHVYRVEGLPDEAHALVDAMKTTKLPAFRFVDAHLPELMKFARENATPQNATFAEVGFLIVGPRTATPDAKPTATQTDALGVASPADRPLHDPSMSASIEAEAMSVWDFLNLAGNTFGYRIEVDAKTVRLLHPQVPDGPLYSRTYNVLPTLVERLSSFSMERRGKSRTCMDAFSMCAPQPDSMEDWKIYLTELGVGWPDGSSVRHIPSIGKLVAVNTMENHRRLEALLRVLNVTPKQVEIDCQLVTIPRKTLEGYARTGRIPSTTILSLVVDGTARLLASPKVITTNGSEAILKAVVEYIYPTEFTAKEPAPEDAGETKGEPKPHAIAANGFETREVGVILQVVPDVTPDGQMIALTLAPQRVSPPSWRDFSVPESGPVGGRHRSEPMEQPFFPVDSLATSVRVYDGSTVVIGGGCPSPDGQDFTYLLLTATLIDPAGREMRKEEPDLGMFFPVVPPVD